MEPPDHRTQRAPDQTPDHATQATGLVAEGHGRVDGVVGRHHLALLEVAAFAHFAALLQLALLHHVAHGRTTLNDNEAVGLLNQHAQHRHGGLQVGAPEHAPPVGVLILDHGDRAHGLVALLELAVGIGGRGAAGRTGSRRLGAGVAHVHGRGQAARQQRGRGSQGAQVQSPHVYPPSGQSVASDCRDGPLPGISQNDKRLHRPCTPLAPSTTPTNPITPLHAPCRTPPPRLGPDGRDGPCVASNRRPSRSAWPWCWRSLALPTSMSVRRHCWQMCRAFVSATCPGTPTRSRRKRCACMRCCTKRRRMGPLAPCLPTSVPDTRSS